MRDFINVGRVVKIHGIKGEVCIDFNADSLALLKNSLFLQSRDGSGAPTPVEYKIKSLRMHKGRPLALLEGVEDRNAAELLRGREVVIPRERLPQPDEDEIYLTELPGLQIFLRNPDFTGSTDFTDAPGGSPGVQDSPLGVLDRVDTPAGQEIWTIITPEGREVLFPATEEFVVSIDPANNTAVIAPPPGLLDIYLAPGKK